MARFLPGPPVRLSRCEAPVLYDRRPPEAHHPQTPRWCPSAARRKRLSAGSMNPQAASQAAAAAAPPSQKAETFMLSSEAQQSLPQDAQVALQQVDNREYTDAP